MKYTCEGIWAPRQAFGTLNKGVAGLETKLCSTIPDNYKQSQGVDNQSEFTLHFPVRVRT